MISSSEITKELDRAALQAPLGKDGRDLCLRILKEGTDAQAVRATAILAFAGEPQSLPPRLRISGWPDLPKRDEEIEALEGLVRDDLEQRRFFIVALLHRKGPQEKTRAKLFRDYATNASGDSPLGRMADAIETLESRIARLASGKDAARRRLLRYASAGLKQSVKRAPRDEVLALIHVIGRLYQLPPKPKATESAELLDLVLSQVEGSDFYDRIAAVRSLCGPDFPIWVLKEGWVWQKVSKPRRALRDRFGADLVAYICSIRGDTREALGPLLDVILPDDTSISMWVTGARANLKALEPIRGETCDLNGLASALRKLAIETIVNLDLLQDLPPTAVSQLTQVFEACALRMSQLLAENEDLKRPETVRALAGQLIREEVDRERALLEELQEYSRKQRADMAARLSESFDLAKAEPGKGLTPALENAIRATISFLHGRS